MFWSTKASVEASVEEQQITDEQTPVVERQADEQENMEKTNTDEIKVEMNDNTMVQQKLDNITDMIQENFGNVTKDDIADSLTNLQENLQEKVEFVLEHEKVNEVLEKVNEHAEDIYNDYIAPVDMNVNPDMAFYDEDNMSKVHIMERRESQLIQGDLCFQKDLFQVASSSADSNNNAVRNPSLCLDRIVKEKMGEEANINNGSASNTATSTSSSSKSNSEESANSNNGSSSVLDITDGPLQSLLSVDHVLKDHMEHFNMIEAEVEKTTLETAFLGGQENKAGVPEVVMEMQEDQVEKNEEQSGGWFNFW